MFPCLKHYFEWLARRYDVPNAPWPRRARWGSGKIWAATTRPLGLRRVLLIALAAVTAVWLVIGPGARAAMIVEFSLENINFKDDSTAVGTFTVNETTKVISRWSIDYTIGTVGLPSEVFTPGDSAASYNPAVIGASSVLFSDPTTSNLLDLELFKPLADIDASVEEITNLSPSSISNLIVGAPFLTITKVTGPGALLHPLPVSEPAVLPLLCGALGLFLIIRRAFWRPMKAPPAHLAGA
jgi:hypothetical protein